MCGIIGIVSKSAVNTQLFDGLTALQHRGQDSAGMVTEDNGTVILRKHNGLVREVFHSRHMEKLSGTIGIGHVRYPTSGTPSPHEAQPFFVNSPYGIALVHNGNLINVDKLRFQLFMNDKRHINTQSDSEILLNIFAQELSKQVGGNFEDNIHNAVCKVYDRCIGGYAVIGLILNHGLVGFRDIHGIRPLVYGVRENGDNKEYCIASESSALDVLDFTIVRDIKPGEMIYITKNGEVFTKQCYPSENIIHTPCLFEYVYFARPDSVIDKVYVHKTRMRMGKRLAKKIKREWPEYNELFDVVIPIPSTSRSIALEVSKVLKVPYRDGFVKNRYIGRTFIMPGQNERKKNIRAKLNPLRAEFNNKNILLVDDSIVRGNTSRAIIELVRSAGAKQVYLVSASPPIRYPNIYGIDMPSANELIAYNKDISEICDSIGADGLIYQDLEDLIYAVSKGNPELEQFDDSVFTGNYITGVSREYLDELSNKRNDNAKMILETDEEEQYVY